MYTKTARFYDLIYKFRDAGADAAAVQTLVERHKRSPGQRLLDVACGTGAHIAFFQGQYDAVEGLDLDAEMLAIARDRYPNVPFNEMDMVDFDLGRQFDVVTCLFSSIGYVETVERLRQAIATMARHLTPGGVLIVEPWLMPEVWSEGHVGAVFVDEPDIKIARINTGRREGNLSITEFHYLIGTADGIEHLTETHTLALFAHDEFVDAFTSAGLEVHHDPDLMPLGRGVYVGVKRG